MRGFRRMPAQTGKQGLFRLVKQAQESYTAEVVTRQKSYRRYVLDFIHSKRYHDETDAWSKNEHLKNYRTIVDLLRGHEKLVRKYFEQEVFDDMQISGLLNEFYTFDLSQTDAPGDILERASAPRTKTPDIVFKPALGRDMIDLIVQLANEVNLFKERLDANDVATRYETDTLQPVTSRNNTRLVLSLDKLASHGIIPYNWQAFIAKRKLVISSSGKKHLDQHDLSSTLNRIKDTPPGISEKRLLSVIDEYIKRIKDKEIQ